MKPSLSLRSQNSAQLSHHKNVSLDIANEQEKNPCPYSSGNMCFLGMELHPDNMAQLTCFPMSFEQKTRTYRQKGINVLTLK